MDGVGGFEPRRPGRRREWRGGGSAREGRGGGGVREAAAGAVGAGLLERAARCPDSGLKASGAARGSHAAAGPTCQQFLNLKITLDENSSK
jgi:hypothetical protein